MASALLLASGCACNGGGLAITGESTKLRLDDPLPSESAVFDGERVELRGVRGETLGVMLTLRGSKQRRVSMAVPVEVARVDAFEVGYVHVREPSTAM